MKPNSIFEFPPKWCADAIASPEGWRHPRTGELLISMRGIRVPVKEEVKPEVQEQPNLLEVMPEEPVIDETVKEEKPTLVEEPVIDETVKEEAPTIVEAPKKVATKKAPKTPKAK